MEVSALQESLKTSVPDTNTDPGSIEARQAQSNANLDVSLARSQEAGQDYDTAALLNRYTGKGTIIDEVA